MHFNLALTAATLTAVTAQAHYAWQPTGNRQSYAPKQAGKGQTNRVHAPKGNSYGPPRNSYARHPKAGKNTGYARPRHVRNQAPSYAPRPKHVARPAYGQPKHVARPAYGRPKHVAKSNYGSRPAHRPKYVSKPAKHPKQVRNPHQPSYAPPMEQDQGNDYEDDTIDMPEEEPMDDPYATEEEPMDDSYEEESEYGSYDEPAAAYGSDETTTSCETTTTTDSYESTTTDAAAAAYEATTTTTTTSAAYETTTTTTSAAYETTTTSAAYETTTTTTTVYETSASAEPTEDTHVMYKRSFHSSNGFANPLPAVTTIVMAAIMMLL